MKEGIKQAVKIAAIFSGAIIGAGFASGQELQIFFVRYGICGLWGIVLAGVLFSTLSAIVLSAGKRPGIANYRDYMDLLFGRQMGHIVFLITELFMMVSFCVMISGGGTLFDEQFHLPKTVGVLITALLCYFMIQGDERHLASVNLYLVPLMVFGMVFVCVCFFLTQTKSVWLSDGENQGNAFFSALLYVSYNMMTAIAVLIPSGRLAVKRKTAVMGGVVGGALLLLVAVLAFSVLFVMSKTELSSELPLLLASAQIGEILSFVYALVLYMAMLTTAAANGFSVMEHVSSRGGNRRIYAAILCLLSMFVSKVPFSRMVDSCYSFFGFLGLCLLGAVMLEFIKNHKDYV